MSIDWAGAALITLAASSLVVWLSIGGKQFAWSSWWTVGFVAVSALSLVDVGLFIALLGLGLDMTMQVLVLAVQNGAQRRDTGVATSAANFFRSMGGAVGIAVFGALLTSRLDDTLPGLLRAAGVRAAGASTGSLGTPGAVAGLPDPVRHAVREAFTLGPDRVFTVGAPVAQVGAIVLLAIREQPLRTHAQAEKEAAEPDREPVPAQR